MIKTIIIVLFVAITVFASVFDWIVANEIAENKVQEIIEAQKKPNTNKEQETIEQISIILEKQTAILCILNAKIDSVCNILENIKKETPAKQRNGRPSTNNRMPK